jgi:5-methyltetrahydrofolate--homocysteine methyltransferase
VVIDVSAIRKAMDGSDLSAIDRLVERHLEGGMPARAVLTDGFIAAMEIVGRQFKARDIFVPEVLVAARAMHRAIELLKPHLATGGDRPAGTVILGTVKGDIHDIGKNILSIMLTGSSFRVVDLGVNVPADRFLAAVRAEQADLVGLSALLTTTMMGMKDVVTAVHETFGVSGPPVMIGGAPVTEEYMHEIAADGYAVDAVGAVEVAQRLIAGRRRTAV